MADRVGQQFGNYQPMRRDNEVIVQHNLSVIGIKLDIQNYGPATFFGSFLYEGKASPPTGAVAGREDATAALWCPTVLQEAPRRPQGDCKGRPYSVR